MLRNKNFDQNYLLNNLWQDLVGIGVADRRQILQVLTPNFHSYSVSALCYAGILKDLGLSSYPVVCPSPVFRPAVQLTLQGAHRKCAERYLANQRLVLRQLQVLFCPREYPVCIL